MYCLHTHTCKAVQDILLGNKKTKVPPNVRGIGKLIYIYIYIYTTHTTPSAVYICIYTYSVVRTKALSTKFVYTHIHTGVSTIDFCKNMTNSTYMYTHCICFCLFSVGADRPGMGSACQRVSHPP